MADLNQEINDSFAAYNGDCVEVVAGLPDASVHFSVYSPPFVGLYIYSDSERDMGNCRTHAEFFQHYRYLIRDLHRVTVSGRLTAVHCKDLPAYHHRDGYSGLKDFPGEIVAAHEAEGWCFHSRVTIWKCPVVERERTNNNGLLHKTVRRDRSQLRQGMADYLLIFRKSDPTTLMSDEPVGDDDGFAEWYGMDSTDPRVAGSFHPSPYARKSVASNNSINLWRRYAEPVWWDVNQQDVLNAKIARTDKDEKHICPLQLGVIERAIGIWSNPGDVVLSPFMGIGSEGVVALRMKRRFIGVELKDSYYRQAVANLADAELAGSEQDLFAEVSECPADSGRYRMACRDDQPRPRTSTAYNERGGDMRPVPREGEWFTTPQGYAYMVTAIGRGRFLASNAGEEYMFSISDWADGKYTHDTDHETPPIVADEHREAREAPGDGV